VRSVLRSRRFWWTALLAMALLIGWTFSYALEPVQVSSNSMSPTLAAGTHVLVDKISSRAHHPRRRDIITFHLAGSSEQLIKRVVAVAGDTVGLADGVLVVDGAKINERFVDHAQMVSVYFGPVTVPSETVFVLGDNRADSVDSRTFGPVPLRDVTGRVLTRIAFG
jgi:signal peptidase I